jgi:peroxiredoxin
VTSDLYTLPEGLPVPTDDSACDHLPRLSMPALTLESSPGPVNLQALAVARLVLYVYPRTGRPDRPSPPGWDAVPGARGCTPQSCAFRDHHAELQRVGAGVAGLSAQPLDEQVEFAERNHNVFYPVFPPDRNAAEVVSWLEGSGA